MENQVNNNSQNGQQADQNFVNNSVITPEKPKTNHLVICGVVLISFLIFGIFGFGGYYLGMQSSKPSISSPSEITPTKTPKNLVEISPTPFLTTGNIQVSTYSNQYFSFEYPKTWQIDRTTIYEHKSDCNPDTYRCLNVKNVVEIRSNITQMYRDFTNEEWFNKFFLLSNPLEDGRDVFTKLANGQTQEGEAYLIFKQGPSESFEGQPLTLIVGYVLVEDSIYELRLSQFSSDLEGVELLKSMIETLKVK